MTGGDYGGVLPGDVTRGPLSLFMTRTGSGAWLIRSLVGLADQAGVTVGVLRLLEGQVLGSFNQ